MASRTQARLRKTFQYPDSDDDDTPEALDEEGSSLPLPPSSQPKLTPPQNSSA